MNKKTAQILLGVGVSVMALGASAFTNKAETNRVGIHVGVLAQGTDANGAYFDVEEFDDSKTCQEADPSDVCSFDFNASALPTGSRIYQSDPRINSTVTGSKYQP